MYKNRLNRERGRKEIDAWRKKPHENKNSEYKNIFFTVQELFIQFDTPRKQKQERELVLLLNHYGC